MLLPLALNLMDVSESAIKKMLLKKSKKLSQNFDLGVKLKSKLIWRWQVVERHFKKFEEVFKS